MPDTSAPQTGIYSCSLEVIDHVLHAYSAMYEAIPPVNQDALYAIHPPTRWDWWRPLLLVDRRQGGLGHTARRHWNQEVHVDGHQVDSLIKSLERPGTLQADEILVLRISCRLRAGVAGEQCVNEDMRPSPPDLDPAWLQRLLSLTSQLHSLHIIGAAPRTLFTASFLPPLRHPQHGLLPLKSFRFSFTLRPINPWSAARRGRTLSDHLLADEQEVFPLPLFVSSLSSARIDHIFLYNIQGISNLARDQQGHGDPVPRLPALRVFDVSAPPGKDLLQMVTFVLRGAAALERLVVRKRPAVASAAGARAVARPPPSGVSTRRIPAFAVADFATTSAIVASLSDTVQAINSKRDVAETWICGRRVSVARLTATEGPSNAEE